MDEEQIIVDLNRADLEILTSLPGIGPGLAERVIGARPFESLEDLQRVSGIGESFIERLRPLVTVAPVEGDQALPAESIAEAEASTEPPQMEPGQVEAGVIEEAEGVVEPEPPEEPPSTPEMEAIITEETPETEGWEALALPPEALEAEAIEEVESARLEPEAEIPPEPDTVTPAPEGEPSPPVKEPPAAPTPAARPAPPAQPRAFGRAGTFWLVLGVSVMTMILGILLSLGFIASLNGGQLQFASPSQIRALDVELDGLENQVNTIEGDLGSLRARVDNLETLSGRVVAIEKNAKELSSDVEKTIEQVKKMERQINYMETQVESLAAQGARFQGFLEGLRELVNSFSVMEKSK